MDTYELQLMRTIPNPRPNEWPRNIVSKLPPQYVDFIFDDDERNNPRPVLERFAEAYYPGWSLVAFHYVNDWNKKELGL